MYALCPIHLKVVTYCFDNTFTDDGPFGTGQGALRMLAVWGLWTGLLPRHWSPGSREELCCLRGPGTTSLFRVESLNHSLSYKSCGLILTSTKSSYANRCLNIKSYCQLLLFRIQIENAALLSRKAI